MPTPTDRHVYVPPNNGGVGGTLPTYTHIPDRTATVTLQEATGSAPDIVDLGGTDSYVHLYGIDQPTTQTATSFLGSPLNATGGPTNVYSCERWIRLKFTGSFNMITRMRLWVDMGVGASVPDGWSLMFGTTPTYTTPVATASAVAVSVMPTVDTFVSNVTPSTLTGTTAYSDWVVIQARATPAALDAPGPIYGYFDGDPLQVPFSLAWGELW